MTQWPRDFSLRFEFSVVVTDPRRADNPIVYASDAFLKLTGYSAAEVLGRNCRFLQGPETERRHLTEMRDAFREERPCKVTLPLTTLLTQVGTGLSTELHKEWREILESALHRADCG